jgi:type IV pilus assembly protein PilQ
VAHLAHSLTVLPTVELGERPGVRDGCIGVSPARGIICHRVRPVASVSAAEQELTMSNPSTIQRLAIFNGLSLGLRSQIPAAIASAAMLSGVVWAQNAYDPMDPRNPRPEPDHGSILGDYTDNFASGDRDMVGSASLPEHGLISPQNGSTGNGSVNVSEFMTVDIFVRSEDLGNVLQMLSLQSRRNIIASKDVQATVTANLYGVTIDEALDAILNVNGYGWIERGNFIYVYPASVIAEMQAAQRKRERKTIRLNYLKASDAALFVEPLLSDAGTITVSGDAPDFVIRDSSPIGAEDYALSATLLVFDYPEHIQEIEALIREIDQRPAQVLIEATILQTQLTEANAFGVDFSIISDMDFQDFFGLGGPLGATDALSQLGDTGVMPSNGRGAAVTGRPGNIAGPGTLKFGIISDDVSVFLRALDEVTDLTVLSNPKILTLNRQAARVLVGRKIGYLNTTSTQTSTTQSVEFLDTGTQLSVRPFVSTDGMIRMELAPRVSEGLIREATDATGAAVTIPDEITQEVTTNVMVPDGSTIVLGGLFREQTKLVRRQVPVLGDIPLIGNAFRGFDDSTDRSEIIFMITPSIVSDKRLIEEGELAIGHMERVRSGSRSALLPWSRDRQTSSLNVEAQRLADEGQIDKALWTIRRSLELNPNQPEAIRLREQLTGERSIHPHRSFLRTTMHEELRQRQAVAFEQEVAEMRARAAATAASQAGGQGASASRSDQPQTGVPVASSTSSGTVFGGASTPSTPSSSSEPYRWTWADEQAFKRSFTVSKEVPWRSPDSLSYWTSPLPTSVNPSGGAFLASGATDSGPTVTPQDVYELMSGLMRAALNNSGSSGPSSNGPSPSRVVDVPVPASE